MLKNFSPWEVPTLTVLEDIKSHDVVGDFNYTTHPYTFLSPQNSFLGKEGAVKELISVYRAMRPAVPISLIVPYRAERWLLHLVLIAVMTTLFSESGFNKLVALSQKIHDSLISENVMKKQLENMDHLWEDQDSSLNKFVNGFVQLPFEGGVLDVNDKVKIDATQLLKKISKRYGETPISALQFLIKIKLFKKICSKAFSLMLNELVDNSSNLYDSDYSKITYSHSQRTLMVCGGQASGKGRVAAQLITDAFKEESYSARKNDGYIYLNADMFKSLLALPLPPNEDFVYFLSQYTHPEAAFVRDRIFKKINRTFRKNGVFPVCFIDQVFLGEDKLSYGLSTEWSEVRAGVASVNVETAIIRSFERGHEEKRYEDTRGVLKGHKLTTADLPRVLASPQVVHRKRVKVTFFDNNRDDLVETAQCDGLNSSFVVKNKELFSYFSKKRNINLGATSAETTYPADLVVQEANFEIDDYLRPLGEAGYNISYKIT